MQETTNYDLKKIELTDSPPDITVINPNWDTVDSELKASEDHIADGDIHFSTTERTKLAGVEAGANAYTHPATHAASIIVQDASKRFVSDTEKATWNGKAEGEHTHDTEDISTGILPVAHGGLGVANPTMNYFLLGNGTDAVQQLSSAVARSRMGLGITTGALPIGNGGTGASTAAAALTALGLPYEVGYWTPAVISSGGGTPSYDGREGAYVRIGKMVMCVGKFWLNGKGSLASGVVGITGLPFMSWSDSGYSAAAIGTSGGWTGSNAYSLTAEVELGSAFMTLYAPNIGSLEVSEITNEFCIAMFTISYLIN